MIRAAQLIARSRNSNTQPAITSLRDLFPRKRERKWHSGAENKITEPIYREVDRTCAVFVMEPAASRIGGVDRICFTLVAIAGRFLDAADLLGELGRDVDFASPWMWAIYLPPSSFWSVSRTSGTLISVPNSNFCFAPSGVYQRF